MVRRKNTAEAFEILYRLAQHSDEAREPKDVEAESLHIASGDGAIALPSATLPSLEGPSLESPSLEGQTPASDADPASGATSEATSRVTSWRGARPAQGRPRGHAASEPLLRPRRSLESVSRRSAPALPWPSGRWPRETRAAASSEAPPGASERPDQSVAHDMEVPLGVDQSEYSGHSPSRRLGWRRLASPRGGAGSAPLIEPADSPTSGETDSSAVRDRTPAEPWAVTEDSHGNRVRDHHHRAGDDRRPSELMTPGALADGDLDGLSPHVGQPQRGSEAFPSGSASRFELFSAANESAMPAAAMRSPGAPSEPAIFDEAVAHPLRRNRLRDLEGAGAPAARTGGAPFGDPVGSGPLSTSPVDASPGGGENEVGSMSPERKTRKSRRRRRRRSRRRREVPAGDRDRAVSQQARSPQGVDLPDQPELVAVAAACASVEQAAESLEATLDVAPGVGDGVPVVSDSSGADEPAQPGVDPQNLGPSEGGERRRNVATSRTRARTAASSGSGGTKRRARQRRPDQTTRRRSGASRETLPAVECEEATGGVSPPQQAFGPQGEDSGRRRRRWREVDAGAADQDSAPRQQGESVRDSSENSAEKRRSSRRRRGRARREQGAQRQHEVVSHDGVGEAALAATAPGAGEVAESAEAESKTEILSGEAQKGRRRERLVAAAKRCSASTKKLLGPEASRLLSRRIEVRVGTMFVVGLLAVVGAGLVFVQGEITGKRQLERDQFTLAFGGDLRNQLGSEELSAERSPRVDATPRPGISLDAAPQTADDSASELPGAAREALGEADAGDMDERGAVDDDALDGDALDDDALDEGDNDRITAFVGAPIISPMDPDGAQGRATPATTVGGAFEGELQLATPERSYRGWSVIVRSLCFREEANGVVAYFDSLGFPCRLEPHGYKEGQPIFEVHLREKFGDDASATAVCETLKRKALERPYQKAYMDNFQGAYVRWRDPRAGS